MVQSCLSCSIPFKSLGLSLPEMAGALLTSVSLMCTYWSYCILTFSWIWFIKTIVKQDETNISRRGEKPHPFCLWGTRKSQEAKSASSADQWFENVCETEVRDWHQYRLENMYLTKALWPWGQLEWFQQLYFRWCQKILSHGPVNNTTGTAMGLHHSVGIQSRRRQKNSKVNLRPSCAMSSNM